MGVLLQFEPRKCPDKRTVLVVAGLHTSTDDYWQSSVHSALLNNCKRALAHAKYHKMSIAFARFVSFSDENAHRQYPIWLDDFQPTREDMIFDIARASFYANMEFAALMRESDVAATFIGRIGDISGVRTAREASRRGHRFTLLSDASDCSPPVGALRLARQSAVIDIMASYGAVLTSSQWISRQLRVDPVSGN